MRRLLIATLSMGLIGSIAYWLLDWVNGFGRTPWLISKMRASVEGDLQSLLDVLFYNLLVFATSCLVFLAFLGLAYVIGGRRK